MGDYHGCDYDVAGRCDMQDLIINLITSLITGMAVWTGQRLLSLRRLAGKRAFFGVNAGETVLLFVARHASSTRPNSVHRNDVATIAELTAVVRECGGQPIFVATADGQSAAGQTTEYCVGGPLSNLRTAAYLRSAVPGVRADTREVSGDELSIWIGDEAFRRQPDREEYVVVVRLFRSTSSRPVFLIIGQRAQTNLAAARYLIRHHRDLRRRYGPRRFCLVLRIDEPAEFGIGSVTLVADKTIEAFASRPSDHASVPHAP